MSLFSQTCLVNNVSRLASQICLAVSYPFFIAAVRSIEIYSNFSPQNNDANVKVIPRLGVSYSKAR